MITVIRDANKNIKTYSESTLDDYNLAMGETKEIVDSTFVEYSRRFMLQAAGVYGQTVRAIVGGDDVTVGVSSTLGMDVVDIDINGTIEHVSLVAGQGEIVLSTANPGIFIIQPANRKLFCAAGNGILTVEVVANGK